uniref:plasmid recombination protein n=1 Tax=Noviherbaspirillum aerium TaxID=2588497 RepID=UPI00178C70AF
MLSFSAGWTKHNRTSIGIARGHNTRAHPTASQLPESAWFTPEGRHEIKAWDEGVVNRAKALAKRKDAVIAIELSIQVGNQSDWRDMPTPEHPEGRPRPDMRKHLKPLAKAAYEAAVREFGEANVISADLHTDESTPHMQITVVPIRDGKLDAKSWLDGAARCAA